LASPWCVGEVSKIKSTLIPAIAILPRELKVTKKQILATMVKLTFLGFLFYFCLRFFVPRWESLQLSYRLGTLYAPWIIAAAVFTLGYYTLGLLIWITILHNLGSKPDLHITARAYAYSLLPKYIPGVIAAHGVRTQLAMRGGLPLIVLMKSFLLEAIFALGTAAAIAVPGTMYFIPAAMDRVSIWVVVFVAVILVPIMATNRFKLARLDGFRLNTTVRSPAYLNVGLLYLLIWLISAAAHWCLANALGDYSISYFPLLLVAVCTSWALGFVSVFAPAGLGVREAVLYFFVNNWMEQTDAILFVTLSRLLMFGVEVFLTAGFLVYSKVAQQAETAMAQ
jgi:glycosyltransferase 2 family protein